MTYFLNKIKQNYRSIIIIIIILLFGIILYNIENKSIDGFIVSVNNGSIFGNFLNTINSNNDNLGETIMNIGTVYRIESIKMNFGNISGDRKFTCLISYNNNGQPFQLEEKTFILSTTSNTSIIFNKSDLLNKFGNRIYTDKLKFTFHRNNSIIKLSDIKFINIQLYGMKLGDYDSDYYINDTINRTFSIINNTNNTIPNEIDINNSNNRLHYFNISNTSTEPPNKLVKGINYNLSSHLPSQPIIFNSINIIKSIDYINSLSTTRYTLADKLGNPQQYTLYGNTGTIYFSIPILAKMLIITTANNFIFTINNITYTNVFGKNPDNIEINTYKIPNYIQGNTSNQNCPPIDIIANNQQLTQKLCDDLENQDKLRIEQIKLEKEKQYLIKLKKQDDDITKLRNEISIIESKRKNRDIVLDNLKLAQYQKQREEAVHIRDIANEKLLKQQSINLAVNLVEEV